MVAFRREDRERVSRGEITVTFRLWRSAHVKAGKVYPTGFGAIEVEDVAVLPAALVSPDDLGPSGCESIEAIWALAGEHTKTEVTPETLLHRVKFRFRGDMPTASEGAPNVDLGGIRQRLERLDARSSRGPWTLQVLRAIEAAPRVPARILAADLEWERLDFKAHVRKLKGLGLTISHEVGYDLSDLGRRYLAITR